MCQRTASADIRRHFPRLCFAGSRIPSRSIIRLHISHVQMFFFVSVARSPLLSVILLLAAWLAPFLYEPRVHYSHSYTSS